MAVLFIETVHMKHISNIVQNTMGIVRDLRDLVDWLIDDYIIKNNLKFPLSDEIKKKIRYDF